MIAGIEPSHHRLAVGKRHADADELGEVGRAVRGLCLLVDPRLLDQLPERDRAPNPG